MSAVRDSVIASFSVLPISLSLSATGPFASYTNPASLQALLPISGAPGMFSLYVMFALLPSLISHRSCILLSTPNPFIRLSALTYQSLFPVLSYPISLCPWHSFLLLYSQYFTLNP